MSRLRTHLPADDSRHEELLLLQVTDDIRPAPITSRSPQLFESFPRFPHSRSTSIDYLQSIPCLQSNVNKVSVHNKSPLDIHHSLLSVGSYINQLQQVCLHSPNQSITNHISYAYNHDDDPIDSVMAICRELRSRGVPVDVNQVQRNMFIRDNNIANKTIEATTQLGKHVVRLPQRAHLKSRYPQLNCRRLSEKFATDTWFSNKKAIGGETCVQLYYGTTSKYTEVY